jgi:pyruvate dehydrogenase E2 component (dihydrolipoamide acetyltransferase)
MAEFKLPELGENITQGTVTKILVKSGDALTKGQNILELETDKAVLEVPSNIDGIVGEIMVKSGSVVKVGQVILKLTDSSAAPTTQAKHLPSGGHVPLTEGKGYVSPSPLPNEVALNVKAPQGNNPTPNEPLPIRKDIPAAPSVRLLARELGIDIALVPGSGPGGRISTGDVKAYCKMLNTSRPGGNSTGVVHQPLPNFTKWGPVRREAMSNVRKKTAEHLSLSWSSIPHVTQCDKVDITELEKLRKSIASTNRKISVTPFIIKVVANALKKFPQFNSSVDMATQEIILKDYVNIGVAVDTDRGLIVPVLKNVDKMSVLQISDELTAMAERARLKKTTIEEMQGGCFTISNLGGIGGNYFTPIINWPEVAILGVSRGAMEAVYMDKQFVPRLTLPLSLSYDHRVIDGADGARFIRWVCENLQQPSSLDLDK